MWTFDFHAIFNSKPHKLENHLKLLPQRANYDHKTVYHIFTPLNLYTKYVIYILTKWKLILAVVKFTEILGRLMFIELIWLNYSIWYNLLFEERPWRKIVFNQTNWTLEILFIVIWVNDFLCIFILKFDSISFPTVMEKDPKKSYKYNRSQINRKLFRKKKSIQLPLPE